MSADGSLIVVGAGRWGLNLIRAACAQRALAGVVDCLPRARAAARLAAPHARMHAALDDALRAHPLAAVVVATPPATHFAVASRAVAARRHVLVEKPLCDSLRDARELVEAARQGGVVLMVDHLLHFSAAHRRLMRAVACGGVGDVTRVRMSRLNFGTVRTEENVLWSLCPHDVSVLLAIVGEGRQLVAVACQGQHVVSQGVHDYVDVTVRFHDGTCAQIEASWLHPYKERRTVVYGTRGSIVLNEATVDPHAKQLHAFHWSATRTTDGAGVTVEKQERDVADLLDDDDADELHRIRELDGKQPLQAVVEHFLHCVKTGHTPRTDGNEALRVLRILTAASESLATGGAPVPITREPADPVAVANANATQVFVHPTAEVDKGAQLGTGTKVWHFSHVMPGARLGARCNIGQNVYIGGRVALGANVKVQNNVSLYDALVVHDDAFLGPSCVFTNVKTPRSHVSRKHAFEATVVGRGATVGANATIVCGVRLGEYSFVGAGAVVTRSVPPHAMVYGNPARVHGWVSSTGVRLRDAGDDGEGARVLECAESGERYALHENGVDGNSEACIVRLERKGQA